MGHLSKGLTGLGITAGGSATSTASRVDSQAGVHVLSLRTTEPLQTVTPAADSHTHLRKQGIGTAWVCLGWDRAASRNRFLSKPGF